MAFKLSNDAIGSYVAAMCPDHELEAGTLRLFGIRGAIPWEGDALGQSVQLVPNKLDVWNDTIGFWGSDLKLYFATVDPGLKYTKDPTNPYGAAHLLSIEEAKKPWKFIFGLHHQQYQCLVQGEAFTVRRDKDRDGIGEPNEPLQTGEFGIHIHYGGIGPSVGGWSAGCQVLRGGGSPSGPWDRFIDICRGSGQHTFSYYLIDGQLLAKHLGLIS